MNSVTHGFGHRLERSSGTVRELQSSLDAIEPLALVVEAQVQTRDVGLEVREVQLAELRHPVRLAGDAGFSVFLEEVVHCLDEQVLPGASCFEAQRSELVVCRRIEVDRDRFASAPARSSVRVGFGLGLGRRRRTGFQRVGER